MGDIFGGGSEPSGTQVIQQSNEPWSGQKTHLEGLFKRAEEQSNTPLEYFPQSTVVPFAPQTETALGMMENRAIGGSPVLQAGQEATRAAASGEMLGPNPYFDETVQAAIRPLERSWNENVMPGINATFSGSGRYGSGAHQRAMDSAGQSFAETVGDISGGLAYQNYADERTNQMGAAALSPSMAAADYSDIAALQQVGQTREGLAGAQLQEQIDRFNFDQTEERQRLADYAALVAGGSFGGTSSTAQPIYSNSTANTLGVLSSGVGIANGLFGSDGLWPGFLN
jgi:hypothetical protein